VGVGNRFVQSTSGARLQAARGWVVEAQPECAFLLQNKGFPQNISNALFYHPMMVVKVILNL